MTSAEEAMGDVASRLEGVVEELTDIALDALRRGKSGRPAFSRGRRSHCDRTSHCQGAAIYREGRLSVGAGGRLTS
jgi:hypothetical protein